MTYRTRRVSAGTGAARRNVSTNSIPVFAAVFGNMGPPQKRHYQTTQGVPKLIKEALRERSRGLRDPLPLRWTRLLDWSVRLRWTPIRGLGSVPWRCHSKRPVGVSG